MTAGSRDLKPTGRQYTRYGPLAGRSTGKTPPQLTVGYSQHKAQLSGMPLGDSTYMYGCFMTANPRGLPLTGRQLTG